MVSIGGEDKTIIIWNIDAGKQTKLKGRNREED
jgi:hypothetical protein